MTPLNRGLTEIVAVGLMATATAFGQVMVASPPTDAASPPTKIQAGPVNGQGAPRVEKHQENAAIRQAARQAARQDWRIVNFERRWWFWDADNGTWSVYLNNAWVPYNPVVQTNLTMPLIPVAPAPLPAVTQKATASGAPGIVRRGPLDLRRSSAGYRGDTTTTVAPIPSSMSPIPATAKQ